MAEVVTDGPDTASKTVVLVKRLFTCYGDYQLADGSISQPFSTSAEAICQMEERHLKYWLLSEVPSSRSVPMSDTQSIVLGCRGAGGEGGGGLQNKRLAGHVETNSTCRPKPMANLSSVEDKSHIRFCSHLSFESYVGTPYLYIAGQ